MTVMSLSILILVFVLLLAGMVIFPVFYGAPWHPTSVTNIRRALEFCEAKPGESLYDLGSGDGRVLITAARYFRLVGVGIEIDPLKVWLSRFLIKRMGLKNSVKIIRKNVYNFDYDNADILFIYLSHQALDRLFPEILGRLKPTVKIICYRFCPRRMEPTKVSDDKTIFLYRLNKGKRLNEKA